MSNVHTQIASASSYIQSCLKLIKMSDEDARNFFENGRNVLSHARLSSENPHMLRQNIVDILVSCERVLNSLRTERANLNLAKPYHYTANISEKSIRCCRYVATEVLDLENIDFDIAKLNGPYEMNTLEKWGRRLSRIEIPLHWCESVQKKGIDVVEAADGKRLVTWATEKKVKRLNEIGIRVFKGRALRFRKKPEIRYWLDDVWIMSHKNYDGKIISALHEDIIKAERLVSRRIRKAVTEALNV